MRGAQWAMGDGRWAMGEGRGARGEGRGVMGDGQEVTMIACLGILTIFATLSAVPAIQGGATQGSTPNTLTLPDGAPRPAARVSDLGWLTGTWTGEGLGGAIDEVWSEPAGGSMVCYFRLVRDGQPVF